MTLSFEPQGADTLHHTPSQAARLGTLCLLMVVAHAAGAARLGEVVSVSPVGQALRVEISAPGSRDDQIASCIRAPAPPPSTDGIPAVRNARITMVGRDQNARIIVTHPTPTGEPILRLLLEDVCAARMQREYVLLLPEPLEVATPAARPAARPAVRTSATPSVAPSAPRGAQTWVTFPGESLESLAWAMYPKDAGARRAFTRGVLRANPDVFVAATDASTPLPPGTALSMPPLANVAAASSAPRAKSSAASAPVADTPARSQPNPATALQTTAPAPATVADRLLLEQATGTSASNDEALDAQAREAAREERVVAAIDRTIDTQLELLQRIRQLEEIQLALRAELEAAESLPALPPQQARVESPQVSPQASAQSVPERAPPPSAATPAPTPAASETSRDWLGWVALSAAIALLLALLLRRRDATSPPTRRTRQAATHTAPDKVVADAWPAAAPTGFDDRSSIDDHRPQPDPTTAQPQPVVVAWDDSDHPTQPGVPDTPTEPPLTLDDDTAEEHESAIELADIMVSFGRLHGAAETLADFIRSNPKQSLMPWLKLMEVYRIADMKVEFDALARQLNKTFNVKTVNWENFDAARKHGGTVEDLPHIVERLTRTWRTRECQAYIETLLRDNREGARQGFGLGVIDDILVLSIILDEQLGRFKPDQP